MELIHTRVLKGDFVILPHALLRQAERKISAADIVYVLKNGIHESEKDEFKESFQSWNYAIR
jgi:hypothetical protein